MIKTARIDRFNSEVLAGGPEACLPCNLTDKWLALLLKQGIAFRRGKRPNAGIVELTTAVTKLVLYKHPGAADLDITRKQFYDYVLNYAIELDREHSRRTAVTLYYATTLETIFEPPTVCTF
jgi:hypothetical protein